MTTKFHHRHDPPTQISIPIGHLFLQGDLRTPPNSFGVVIFVHGSGSGRLSPRNQYVAEELNQRGFTTLLLDLLTDEEQQTDARTMQHRFDIPLLADRATLAARWIHDQSAMSQLPIGLFGASTGAAAALITAARMRQQIAAVVSRGGRPDLAAEVLDRVEAPTLLIVGGKDNTVLALNRKALKQMRGIHQLHVVPGATHLFEETGALEQVVNLAGEWFTEHMNPMSKRATATG